MAGTAMSNGEGERLRKSSWLRRPSDPGSVTAEFAVVLPAVMVVALIVMGLGRSVMVGIQCQDSARAAAREIAVSQQFDAQVHQRALSAATKVSAESSVSLSEVNETVVVTVTCPLMPGPLGVFPAQVRGNAVAMLQGKS